MIAFLDAETTGLNPKIDSLLEVAVIIVDDDLETKCSINTVMRPVGGLDKSKIDPYVIEMHTKNGLFNDVEHSGIRLYEAEAALVKFMEDFAKRLDVKLEDLKMPLAGNTIGFDRNFLQEYMPQFHALFHYRSIDVTAFNETAARFRPSLHKARPRATGEHRAFADARNSIDQLRFYRNNLFQTHTPTVSTTSGYTLVVVESPYAPSIMPKPAYTREQYIDCICSIDGSFEICSGCKEYIAWRRELETNEQYARACMKDCLKRGESPYASHMLYTQPGVLDDTNPKEREWGIQAGFAWRQVAAKTAVYTDRGISKGMQYGIDDAEKRGIPVEIRQLGNNWKELLK